MGAPEELGQIALQKQPVYYNDPSWPWEQKLAAAYDEATKLLQAAVPAGTTLDTAQYELASDAAGAQVDAYGDAWMRPLQSADPSQPLSSVNDVDQGMQLGATQARQYYLGTYAQASSNLGAYLTGYARAQIPVGVLTQAEFDQGAEMRLRQFSQIIHAGRTGSLPAVIAGERYAMDAGVTGAQARLTVASGGVTAAAVNAAAGLGLTGVEIALIVLVAGLVIAGTVVAVYWAKTSSDNRATMLQICQQAIANKDPKADLICANMTQVVAQMASPGQMPGVLDSIVGKDALNKITTFAAVGAGLYLLVTFAPEIARSLQRTKGAMTQTQTANLARTYRRYGRTW